jgi:hypothetical protein
MEIINQFLFLNDKIFYQIHEIYISLKDSYTNLIYRM